MALVFESVGGAETVTGSRHLLRSSRATVLVDCGLFQGHRRESNERNRALGLDPSEIDAVVLTHAHIDHSGALPVLVKRGYEGSIYATSATRDLCAAMLEDAAMIQAADARYIQKLIEREAIAMDPAPPLYDDADVALTMSRFIGVPYHRKITIAPGVVLTMFDAGHVLGSAVCALDVDDEGQTRRVLFSGDLGRHGMPILRDPEVVSGASALVLESTYGDRKHEPYSTMAEALREVIVRAVKRGGKIVIPSFALERAQEVVYALKELANRGELPRIPVYVDSPLTVKITDVFRLHPDCFDAPTRALLDASDSPFDVPGIKYVSDKQASQAIDAEEGSSIVISASGMCEGGRVLHHLKATIESEKNVVLLVGYQAPHTLGRRIAERRRRVKIFGVERDLRAEVVVLNGFSAHADSDDLVRYAEEARERGPLRDVFVVHGEPTSRQRLAERLRDSKFSRVHTPRHGERIAF
jgi:metallo-beta-lactamase family protein